MNEKSSTESFKKPFLPIGPIFDPLKKSLYPTISDSINTEDQTSENTENGPSDTDVDEKKSTTIKKDGKSSVCVPLPYQEPDWSDLPPPSYYLEIIKNGTHVSTLPVGASLVVFGRLEVCDVVFEHPSVSRYHAVIQYCKGDDAHPKGFYLYDLGSTHGTFLNKERIQSKIYYKLKVGYILKFGGSSRLHIFQGPEEEEEQVKIPEVVKNKEEDGCSWGLGEEAVEEDDLAENPFALSAPNEELYIEDPKKTLRGWFEREGYELEYNVEEKGYRTFSCTIKLPIDTATGEFLPVEASVNGKKKEAVIACALEACRTLDRMGLLRQSHHESRQRKRKKWEENDYYDSDEDTFYDRTGEIEKRREMRKRLAKKVEVDNFESLSVKLEKLNAEMKEIKSKISSNTKNSQGAPSDESDPLDMYMSNLSESGNSISDKFERRKLKLRLLELEKQKVRLEKLSDIARPTRLPPIAKHPGIIGKKLKSKLKLTPAAVTEVVVTNDTKEQIEEEDSDIEDESSSKSQENNVRDTEKTVSSVQYGLIIKSSVEPEKIETKNEKISNIQCDSDSDKSEIESLTDKKCTFEKKISIMKCESNIDTSAKILANEKLDISSSKPIKSVKSSKRNESSKREKVDVYKTSNTEYCTWMPPTNQSGDGMTHLNDKYGY